MNDSDLELLTLRRQLAWDMVAHGDLAKPENQVKFGLQPTSQEVTEAEHRAADIRLYHVAPFMGRIAKLSGLAALVAKPLILELLNEFMDESERDARVAALCAVISTAVVSDLLDKNLVVGNFREHY